MSVNYLTCQLIGSSHYDGRYVVDRFWNPRVSSTFHGRDIVGPVAAHWSAGQAIEAFGPRCSAIERAPSTAPRTAPEPIKENDRVQVQATVIAVDGFGNAITNRLAESLSPRTVDEFQLVAGDHRLRLATTWGQFPIGTLVLLADASHRAAKSDF